MTAERINWYRTPLEKEQLAELNRRSDFRGLIQCGSLLLLAVLTGTGCWLAWQSRDWRLILPAFFLHGTLISFFGPAAAVHELSHGSPFKTKAWNEFFLRVFSFLSWSNFVFFRTSHALHHQLTLHKGRDLEVVLPLKIHPIKVLYWFTFNPVGMIQLFRTHLRHCRGIVDGEWEERIFPSSNTTNRAALFHWARMLVFGHLVLAILFIIAGQPVLILIVQCPFYAGWLASLTAFAQHTGLKSDIDDFRYLCRTMRLSPLPAYLYWNMNYHTEHHMFPAVPFWKLPRLHALVQDDMPVPNRGLCSAWKEILRIQKRQKTDPEYDYDSFERT